MLMSFKVLFPALLCAAVAGAAEAASFDCSKAASVVEKKICASKILSKLDSRMAEAYRVAQDRVKSDEAALTELRRVQREYLRWRGEYLSHPAFDFEASMRARLAFLEGISGEQRKDFAGEWQSYFGTINIPKGDTGVNVRLEAAEPATARWICNFEGKGKREGAVLLVDQAEKPEPEDDWHLRITQVGRLLKIEEIEPKTKSANGYAGARPYCGMNGFVSGLFFPFDTPKGRGE